MRGLSSKGSNTLVICEETVFDDCAGKTTNINGKIAIADDDIDESKAVRGCS